LREVIERLLSRLTRSSLETSDGLLMEIAELYFSTFIAIKQPVANVNNWPIFDDQNTVNFACVNGCFTALRFNNINTPFYHVFLKHHCVQDNDKG
jgi:hypothetical protein